MQIPKLRHEQRSEVPELMPTLPWAVSSTWSALQFSGWCPGSFFVWQRGYLSLSETPVRRDLGRLNCLIRSGAHDLSALVRFEGLRKEKKHQDPGPTEPKTTARTGSVLGLMPTFHGIPSFAGTLDGSGLLPDPPSVVHEVPG